MTEFDLVVVGAGSGGVRAARMAAQLGARVALVEGAALGGTCVNLGCIPKKLYAYASGYGAGFHEAQGYGWDCATPSLDWERLKHNRRMEIGRLNSVYADMLVGAGVELIPGWAEIVGPERLRVDGELDIGGRWILIATGGLPAKPSFEGADLCLSSDQVFDMPRMPRKMAVIGGGYIATEFASIFNGLGAHVTQVHRGSRILRGFDAEIAAFAQRGLHEAGVELALGRTVRTLAATDEGLRLELDDGHSLVTDTVLYAGGREANVQRLGWAAAGGATDADGRIVVDERHQTNIPGIFAVGDVCSREQLTPVALAQAMAVVQRLFAERRSAWPVPRLDMIPSAVFLDPCIATVGLTEAQAGVLFDEVEIYTSDFRPLRHALSGSPLRTFIKLLVEAKGRRVIGVHVAGEDAAEILQGFAVAMRAGATKEHLDETLGIHPTSAEELCTMRRPTRVLRRPVAAGHEIVV